MRILIAGQREFGAEIIRLARKLGHEIVAVSCPRNNSTGTGSDRAFSVAATFGIPVIPAGQLNAGTVPKNLDLIVAAHSHDFVGRATRLRSRYGAVGYHPSLLPRHRGRDAIRWSIHMRESITGGTVYWLNEVMDGGPIAAQDWCWIYPGESAADVWRRALFPMGVRLMSDVLQDVEGFFVNKEPQDLRLATFEPAFDVPRRFRPDLLGLPSPGTTAVSEGGEYGSK
jgi:methionyl-tRNA formyltransferase